MTTSTKNTQISPDILATLAARFPDETPDQIADRARRVQEMCMDLQVALGEFWAGRR